MAWLIPFLFLVACPSNFFTFAEITDPVLADDISILTADEDDPENFILTDNIYATLENPLINDLENFNENDEPNFNVKADSGNDTENIVELLIVCDKDFGDYFNQDRKKILDYWTVYMWDLSLRFKSLKNIKISFQVTGIVVIKDKKAQRFIEQARGSNGRPEHGRILSKFSSWVYEKKDLLPKFDLAIIVEKTEMEGNGGRSFRNSTCQIDDSAQIQFNVLSIDDDGNWNSVTTAAQQIGYSLGAANEMAGDCKERGYIMSDNPDLNKKWFFSNCSDRDITEFVKSDTASCLRRKDNKRNPILSPKFEPPLAISMEAQCKQQTKNDYAYVEKNDSFNCREIKCLLRSNDEVQTYNFPTVDNTFCGDVEEKRCFRGRCRQIGYLLKNVASGLCMRAKNPFYFNENGYEMVPCSRYANPLDRIVMERVEVGVMLMSPFSQRANETFLENDDKCAFIGKPGGKLRSDRCRKYNEWIGWELQDTGEGPDGDFQFFIVHKKTKRVLKPETREISSVINAVDFNQEDTKNDEFKWTRSL